MIPSNIKLVQGKTNSVTCPHSDLVICIPLQYEDLVCFRDIRPGAPHHYLVVPVEHMGNCKTLKSEHVPIGKAENMC